MAILEHPATTAADRAAGATRARPRVFAPWVGLGVALVTYIGAGIPSYWGDEAASVMSAQRPWSSLASELTTVDAVHGMYYALLHLWVGVFGAAEWSTRALSTIGIGFLAAGVVVLGRRWFDQRTAVLAGLLIALIPRASLLAVETRGYAIAAAAAVWLTILFVRLVDRDARRRAWIGYGIAVAVSGTFFLYLLMMPVVHFVALRTRRERTTPQVVRRWLTSLAIAAPLALPIVVVSQFQKGQIAFLAHRSYVTLAGVVVTPWFGHLPVALAMWPLLILGALVLARASRRGETRAEGFLPVLTWLLLPAFALILFDLLISPVYNPRYLSFSLAAVALLISAGVWAVLDAARRIGGRKVMAAAVIVLTAVAAVTAVPEFVRQRTPFAKDGGADFRAAAAQVGAHARPGDTVLFGITSRNSRAPRLAYRLYPADFTGLRDPQLITAYDRTNGLWDRLATVSDVARGLSSDTVWLLESGSTGSSKADLAALQAAGFTRTSRTPIHRTVVYEFQKGMQP
ncbi:glycosyltransferase family 39 protein [Microbacterium sp. NPDC057650]|uniref:glycosyltransferase family 39 protein n=1 Tax=unclassified Microbacterium TaxID=2609290 RepID=UPI0036725D28